MENSSTLPLGHRIKEYSLEGILGQGGFGIVYRGIHTQLREEVVIKELLPSELAGRNGSQVVAFGASKAQIFDDCLNRFVEEGRTLRKLQHKNVVSCRDLFSANGTVYLVMDYEDGMPLDNLISQIEHQDKQYNEEELLHFLIPLAEGIAYIHSKGVLHRDIKPANVYIRRCDGSPVLLDFGSAKQNYAESTQSKAPYTEFYAPLEQIEGGGEAKASIDIYAFGALMYRLITGVVGPKAETRAMAIVYGKPDPLEKTVPWKAQMSKELCLLVDQCLAFKPSERPATMVEVLRVLKRTKGNDRSDDEYQPKVKRQIKYKDFDRIRGDVHAALGASGRIHSKDRARIYLKAASFGFNKVDVENYIASVEKNYLEQKNASETAARKESDDEIGNKSDVISKIKGNSINKWGVPPRELDGIKTPEEKKSIKTPEEKKSINWVFVLSFVILIFFVYGAWVFEPNYKVEQVEQLERYRVAFQVSPKVSSVKVYNRNTYKSTTVGHGSSWFEKGDYKITVSASGHEDEVRYVSVYQNSTLKFDLNKVVKIEPKKIKHASNDIKAVKWFRKSANQGNARAQYNLASMYEKGRGVDKDMKEAVRWYVESAKQGNEDAQSKLKAMGKSWN
jgi:serine/threonine protein kinase